MASNEIRRDFDFMIGFLCNYVFKVTYKNKSRFITHFIENILIKKNRVTGNGILIFVKTFVCFYSVTEILIKVILQSQNNMTLV